MPHWGQWISTAGGCLCSDQPAHTVLGEGQQKSRENKARIKQQHGWGTAQPGLALQTEEGRAGGAG